MATLTTIKQDGITQYVLIYDDGSEVFVPNDSQNRFYQTVQDWIVINGTPDEYVSLADFLAKKKAQVKEEAQRRILALYPDWKQRNLINEITKIITDDVLAKEAIPSHNLSAADKTTITNYNTSWQQIIDIRTKSDAIEIILDGLTYQQLIDYDVQDNDNWT